MSRPLISTQRRTTAHYLIALLLFALYGTQVCPFLDSLTTVQLLVPILLTFTGQWLLRLKLEQRLQAQPLQKQAASQFRYDLGLFISGGLLLALYNLAVWQFPLESSGKIIVGMLVLGYLIACELALHRERQIALQAEQSPLQLNPDDTPYPLTRKFTWFASLCAISVIGVIFLIINKDLEWLQHAGAEIPLATAQRYILAELAFTIGAVMSYVLAIIFAYAGNLKLFLQREQQALQAVTSGDMSIRVPVGSNDEFGLIAHNTNSTIDSLEQRTRELNLTRDVSILALASLAETRDNETGAHIIRTQYYVKALAEDLKDHPDFCQYLCHETIQLLFKSAPLHDVGKVGIPDAILLKPGKLTDEEFDVMKRHPRIGADALKEAEGRMGSNSFLRLAREISLTHHEKWNGSGYPAGLSGDQIPVSGRLMALADVYDALISKRVYKPAFSHEKARGIILEGSGSHFDPRVVEAFLRCEDQFTAIAVRHSDEAATADVATNERLSDTPLPA